MSTEHQSVYLKPGPIRPKIKHIIMMGDSLSDRGTMNKRLLFGWLPMHILSGLKGTSPDGRFTNGLAWSDHITAQIASDFTIKRLEKKWHLDHTDIADAIIAKDKRILHTIHDNYSLDDDEFVRFKNKTWVRSYCEGGLMAYDYGWSLSYSIVRFFTRIILSSLTDKRNKLMQHDTKHRISCQQKAETLVIEWSGSNDLITVNAEPSYTEVDRAIASRVLNVKKLVASGYRHFVLFNLPNLGLTPRYQAKSAKERLHAEGCSYYFNSELSKACMKLQRDFPHCSIKVHDVNSQFEAVYRHPKKHLFDKDKLTSTYLESPSFDSPEDGVSPSTGYMFYDDVHPTADMHAVLAQQFYQTLQESVELLEPDDTISAKPALSEGVLLSCFCEHYKTQLEADRNSFFSFFSSTAFDYKHASLEQLLDRAIYQNDARTKSVLMALGWLKADNTLMLDNPDLIAAMERVGARHSVETIATC